ncbi:unnamed protein product [Brachionus calyciflorus]|uniref:39S ribosomal protein L34, mitochondrial n=1 Tax=Brachionus calyciflorus TaxID=104777 RepID=A0A814HKQ6_9BILA|nr:unnamed protein product [Brachionus calyciflorus]
MSFLKSMFKSLTQVNLLKNFSSPMTNSNRGFKAEVFYHNRGLFSNDESPRGRHYQCKVMKRIRTHGLETRLQTRGGKQMLWKKIIKGPRGWIQFVPAP